METRPRRSTLVREIRDDVLDMVRECRNEDPDSYAHGLLLSIGGACDMALREPMRNCDRYSHDEALAAWAAEKENAGNGCFDEWLYQKEPGNDGRKKEHEKSETLAVPLC